MQWLLEHVKRSVTVASIASHPGALSSALFGNLPTHRCGWALLGLVHNRGRCVISPPVHLGMRQLACASSSQASALALDKNSCQGQDGDVKDVEVIESAEAAAAGAA